VPIESTRIGHYPQDFHPIYYEDGK
jgi:hypothetical protein